MHGVSFVMKMADNCFQIVKLVVWIQICGDSVCYQAILHNTTSRKGTLQKRKSSSELIVVTHVIYCMPHHPEESRLGLQRNDLKVKLGALS